MTSMIWTGPTGTLRWTQDMHEVTSWSRSIDPNWKYTDRHGHIHRYVKDFDYPTLDLVRYPGVRVLRVRRLGRIISRSVRRLCRRQESFVWRCRLCREIVRPGTLPAGTRLFVPGMKRYWLNDVPITEQEFNERIAVASGCNCGHEFEPNPSWFHLSECALRRAKDVS